MINSDYEGVSKDDEVLGELYARHAELETFKDLETQRGTPIPALFNQFYKFIQNPSTVSVETFKRMVDTDDTIGAGVDFLTTCLAARMGSYSHPSEEVTQWVNKALDKIEGGSYNAIKEMLSAAWVGFSVQEKVWANTEEGFIIEKLVPLPPATVLFETERTGELTADGILQYQRNYNPLLASGGINFFGGMLGTGFTTTSTGAAVGRPDVYAKFGDLPFPLRTANTYNYLSVRIPKDKCVHYAFDAQGKFGNPYGRSLLRRAYKFYVMKDAFLQMLAVALDRKGTPLTVVWADANTTIRDKAKAGDSTTNVRGQEKGIRADVAARDAFKNIHNDTVIVLPGKKDSIYSIDTVQNTSNADVFIQAIELCNKSIMRALLVPSLIFTNGDGTGSFALGQEHAKTFDKILDGILAGAKSALLQQVIKPLLAYNFPRSVWEKDGLGDFAKRELTPDEREKEMDKFEKGINSGVIDVNNLKDLNKMRDAIGFEPVDEVIGKPQSMMGDMFNGAGDDGDNGIAGQTEEQDDGGGLKGDQDGGPSGAETNGRSSGGKASPGDKPSGDGGKPKGKPFGGEAE